MFHKHMTKTLGGGCFKGHQYTMVYWQLKVLCCNYLCSHWQDKESSGNLIVARGVDGWRGGGEGPVRDTPAGKRGLASKQTSTPQHKMPITNISRLMAKASGKSTTLKSWHMSHTWAFNSPIEKFFLPHDRLYLSLNVRGSICQVT